MSEKIFGLGEPQESEVKREPIRIGLNGLAQMNDEPLKFALVKKRRTTTILETLRHPYKEFTYENHKIRSIRVTHDDLEKYFQLQDGFYLCSAINFEECMNNARFRNDGKLRIRNEARFEL